MVLVQPRVERLDELLLDLGRLVQHGEVRAGEVLGVGVHV